MPHAETYAFGQLVMSNRHAISERTPRIYVEYGPSLRHGCGTVVAAEEFVGALAALPPDTPAVMSLRVIRDCCGLQPWVSVIGRAIWWKPGTETVLEVGRNRLTVGEFRHLVRWIATVPFLDPCHDPYLWLEPSTHVRLEGLCRRLGIRARRHVA